MAVRLTTYRPLRLSARWFVAFDADSVQVARRFISTFTRQAHEQRLSAGFLMHSDNPMIGIGHFVRFAKSG